jgi:hypothetical protein
LRIEPVRKKLVEKTEISRGRPKRIADKFQIPVTPGKAGVQNALKRLAFRFRKNGEIRPIKIISENH